jgi:hypothetical protein
MERLRSSQPALEFGALVAAAQLSRSQAQAVLEFVHRTDVDFRELPAAMSTVQKKCRAVAAAYDRLGTAAGRLAVRASRLAVAGTAGAPPTLAHLSAYYREPADVIKRILCDPKVSHYNVLFRPDQPRPAKIAGGVGQLGEPYYAAAATELHASILARFTSPTRPAASILPLPLILNQDGANADQRGQVKLEPLYLQVAALPRYVRDHARAMGLLALLPHVAIDYSTLKGAAARKDRQRFARQSLFHFLEDVALRPLRTLFVEGLVVEGIPGAPGPLLVVPYLLSVGADIMARNTLFSIIKDACLICTVQRPHLGRPPGVAREREAADVWELYEAAGGGSEASLSSLREAGFHLDQVRNCRATVGHD